MTSLSIVRRACAAGLGTTLLLITQTLSAASVVEVSKDLSFGVPAINSGSSVAYFAFTDDFDEDVSHDGLSLKRDGSTVVGNLNNYVWLELSGLDISDSGRIAFAGAHLAGGNQVYGGFFRGSSPGQPTRDDNDRWIAVFMRGDTLAASPRGQFVDRDFVDEQIFCTDVKLTSNQLLACGGGATKLYDQGRGARVSRPAEVSDNGKFAVRYYKRSGTLPTFDLYRFDSDPDVDHFVVQPDYRVAIGNQFSNFNILQWEISNTGTVAVLVQPIDAPDQRDIYRISSGGGVSLVVSEPNGGIFRLFGIDASGRIAYFLNSVGYVFSTNPSEPIVASGHAIEDYVITVVGDAGPNSYHNGKLALRASLCRLDDREDCYRAIIIADGSTTDAPDPPDPNAPPADVVLWNSAQDGSFFDDQNWNPQTAPDSDQVAVFAPDAAVTVSFGGQTANTEKLVIERGPVIFDGGSYQLNTGNDANPSLVLRSGAPGDVAALWLTGGHQLQTRSAMLDRGNSVGGLLNGVILEDDLNVANPQSRWDNIGRLVVDANLSISWSGGLISDSLRVASTPGSAGDISVGPSPLSGLACPDISIADFGPVSIGYAGQGTMNVERDCAVEATGDRIVGELAGSQGEVTFRESSWIRFYNPGPATKLTVGRFGNGVVNVWDSSVGASDVIIGQFVGSDSYVWVDTPDTTNSLLEAEGTLFVGAGGKGLLRTSGNGRVVATDVTIGAFADSIGRVFLTGPSTENNLNVAGLLVVGENGNAELEIVDGASALSQSGLVGGGAQGNGLVEIKTGGSWDIAGDLTLGLSSSGNDPVLCDGNEVSLGIGELRLQGDGQLADITGQTLTIDGPGSRISGTGLAVFQNTVAINCAVLAPGNSPGMLTFNGNLQLNGGVIEIELSGLNDGDYDVLNVTGNADLSGGIVKFIFDGFLPQQGDQITFLETGGTLNLDDNMRYEYQGANDGFDFDVTTDDEGNITFTANNDAIDLLFGNGFE